jgi:hypothetical protein
MEGQSEIERKRDRGRIEGQSEKDIREREKEIDREKEI